MAAVDVVTVAGRDSVQLLAVLDALLVDVTAIRTGLVATTAGLDLDAGITATDFASTCNPAALTTTT